MIDAAFSEKRGNGLDRFAFVFAAFVSPEVDELVARLAFDERNPVLENLEDRGGRFVGDDIDPSITGGFVDEDEEVQAMSEGFRRDWANIGIDAKKVDV